MGVNHSLAVHVFQELYSLGVRELCVCPGKRNAPWVALLAQNPKLFKTYYFYEERSAAFFALGRIKNTGNPVAVITTSGTAVGELLPATMEAHYAGLPLILVTADRPKFYRGQGAPQSAEHVGIFSSYVVETFDLEKMDRPNLVRNLDLQGGLIRPIHINACFDEPLLDGDQFPSFREVALPPHPSKLDLFPAQKDLLTQFVQRVKNPLILVGMLAVDERAPVLSLLKQWKVPVYLEGTSGLREQDSLKPYQICFPEGIFKLSKNTGYDIDGVLRIGGVPTLRLWRDLEDRLEHLPVLSLSLLPFSGLGRASFRASGPLEVSCQRMIQELEKNEVRFSISARDEWIALDQKACRLLVNLFNEEPRSEAAMVSALSQVIPPRSNIYLGNSMPIREWDMAATLEERNFEVWASRGLNGIDGQISTFLGFARPEVDNWALIGDLTALYDLAGPWILSQMPKTSLNIGVINNGGGKIFSRMFPYSEFLNLHPIRFRPWAELWNVPFESWEQVPKQLPGQLPSGNSHRIVELLPQEEATQRFWKKFNEILNHCS